MGARRGEQVIQRFKEQPPEVWHRGKKVEDITTEPGFSGGVASLAELYDVQWADPEVMLFTGDDGELSFLDLDRNGHLTRKGRDYPAL